MKVTSGWYSERLEQHVSVSRWGFAGVPVLVFPTAGGDAYECERMGVVAALDGLLGAGKIRLYSCDSVSGRCWTDGVSGGSYRAAVQLRFDAFVARELIAAIRTDCGDPNAAAIVGGASIGAFNALSVLCRHPELFASAFCLSGTYDLERWMGGEHPQDFHNCSPIHFLPHMADGPQLEAMRRRFVIFATGEGRWEAPGESWHAAHVLGQCGVANRVDPWGSQWDHDWPTWRAMVPRYVRELVARSRSGG